MGPIEDASRNDTQPEAGKSGNLSREAIRKATNTEDVFNSTNMSFGKEIEQI